jgi:hypothetical protein
MPMKLFLLIAVSVFCLPNASKAQSSDSSTQEFVTLFPFISEITVKVGQQLCYTASVHSSVGNEVTVASEYDSILQLQDRVFEYNNLENSRMSGGDAATENHIYAANSVGECDILIKEYFRGELKDSYMIRVNVIE